MFEREWRRIFFIEANHLLGESSSNVENPNIQDIMRSNPHYFLSSLPELFAWVKQNKIGGEDLGNLILFLSGIHMEGYMQIKRSGIENIQDNIHLYTGAMLSHF